MPWCILIWALPKLYFTSFLQARFWVWISEWAKLYIFTAAIDRHIFQGYKFKLISWGWRYRNDVIADSNGPERMWQLCAQVGCVRPTHNLATTNSITFKPSLTSFTPRSISQPPLVKLNPKVSGSTAYKMKTIAVCAILCMLCLGGKITYESLLWSYCNRKDLILRAWSTPVEWVVSW